MKTEIEHTSRRGRERQRRIELILESAEKLFLEKGFTATTMSDIGDAAEFGRATLYHYFPNKEAIYVAILERAMDSLIADARESVGKARTAKKRIQRLKDALLSFVRKKENFFRLYFITRFEVFPHLDRKLAEILRAKTNELDSIFHEIYEIGARSGEFEPGDPLSMGDIFFAQIIGLMLLNDTAILEPPLTAIVNKATNFFLDNVASNKEKGKHQ